MKKQEYHEEGIRLIEKNYNGTYTDGDLSEIALRGYKAFSLVMRLNTYGRKYSSGWFAMFMMGLFYGAYLHCEDEEQEEELETFFKTAKKMKKETQQAQ
jgi:hypothetical protein